MSTFKKESQKKVLMRILLFFALFLSVYLMATLGYQKSGLSTAISPVYANAIIFGAATFILVPLFRKIADKRSFISIGLTMKTAGKDATLGLMLATAILGTGSLLLYFNHNLEYFGITPVPADLFAGLGLMGLIAFSEEIVFRGYVLGNLLESLNKWLALIISAALFALVHSGNPEVSVIAIINVFVAGILLGINYVYTRNLWFSIVFHFAWNFLQGPVLGFDVSGLELESLVQADARGSILLTGGKFGFEASVIETALFLISIFLLFRYYKGGDLNSRIVAENKNPGIESEYRDR